jgi:hypothetical protein
MLKVLLYDLRESALFLLPVAFIGSVGALSTARFGPAFFWWSTLLTGALALLGPTVEWRNGTSAFLHSLPASRGQVVAGRFLGGALAIAAGGVLASSLGLGLAFAVSALGRPWPVWVTPDVLLAFIVVSASVAGPAIACVFVFGLGPGAAVASVWAVGAAAAVEGTGVLWNGQGAADRSAAAGGGIVRIGMSAAIDRIGLPATAMTAVVIAGVVLWGSALVAWRAHRRREF